MNRILIVTRRYWPCTNDAALRLRRLTDQLCSHQWRPTVLTPRWHSSWPCRLNIGETRLIRLDAPPLNPLRQMRYLQNLKQWVDQHSSEFEAVYCDQPDWDADTVFGCLSNRKQSLIVRWDPDEPSSECSEATMRACSRATTVLVPSAWAHQRAIASGVSANQIVRTTDWWVAAIDRTLSSYREARKILCEVNADLNLHRRDRLMVVPGELTSRWRIDFLIRSIGKLIDQQPGLRLWILGNGSGREQVYSLLQDFGIHRIVALPGMFTSIETVLQAADLCLFPGHDCGLGFLIPTCIISGIPILAARSSVLESQTGQFADNLSFVQDSAEDILQRVQRWWESPDELEEAARSAQRFLRRQMGSSQSNGNLLAPLRLPSLSSPSESKLDFDQRLRPAQ